MIFSVVPYGNGMLDFAVPRQAIAAFEEIHALRITVHDLNGTLWPYVDPDRLRHSQALCEATKSSAHRSKCMEFEIDRLRAALPTLPNGRYHVCHAGLMEWVVPVYRKLELEWVLFAGVRTADSSLIAHRESLTRWTKPPWGNRTPLPPPVARPEAERILEHLRQMAARLWDWSINREHALAGAPETRHSGTTASDTLAIRRTRIHRFIAEHHASEVRLSDLADSLGVGEDRAGRIVQESCGRPFREWLIEARLRTAMELLRNTTLPVLQVSLRSGFNEVAHFNRLFRKRIGTTPMGYRKRVDI